mmetsp:Transcript_21437/g.53853  ORF Transcript_21437/g.53853 Transcript_21437/m.53853 type:complete len:306 (-) Transcript_21437:56-973(-)
MSTLLRLMLLALVAPIFSHEPVVSSILKSLSSLTTPASVKSATAELNLIWVGVRGARMTYSCFWGRPSSTSALRRRRRKGSRMVCSLEMVLLWISSSTRRAAPSSAWRSSSKSNQVWKVARSWKMSGRMKLSRDHSSVRLFCSGVPDSSSLLAVSRVLSSLSRRQSLFLRRWPSSTTRYFHLRFWSLLLSFMATSKEVRTTGKILSLLCLILRSKPTSSLICRLSSLLPWYTTVGMVGAKRLNSLCQFCSVERGTTMRKGPATFMPYKCARNAIVWHVLPSPISSARMPLRPFSHREEIHTTPST